MKADSSVVNTLAENVSRIETTVNVTSGENEQIADAAGRCLRRIFPLAAFKLALGQRVKLYRAPPTRTCLVGLKSVKRKNGCPAKAVKLPKGYKPGDTEQFMNARQREYFRRKLVSWRAQLLHDSSETIRHLQEDTVAQPDFADRATAEVDRALELRTRDRERKLISKIDEALRRIEQGTYGYCEETGEPIGLRRLEARPIATFSLEAQERHERRERVHRDD